MRNRIVKIIGDCPQIEASSSSSRSSMATNQSGGFQPKYLYIVSDFNLNSLLRVQPPIIEVCLIDGGQLLRPLLPPLATFRPSD